VIVVSRVIAGTAGGRRLVMPPGRATRPTADRAREGLFSTLTALLGGLSGASVLDLYAGSGAVGLEAASRGASRVVLVEREPAAARTAQANIDSLDLPSVELWVGAVEPLLTRGRPAGDPESDGDGAFDVAFLDPPYADSVDAALAALVDGGWLAAGAVVAVERASRGSGPTWPVGLIELRSRRYGEATLWYGRRS
jgi:16S rRNA (guanine966-N2)-methyltransferase